MIELTQSQFQIFSLLKINPRGLKAGKIADLTEKKVSAINSLLLDLKI